MQSDNKDSLAKLIKDVEQAAAARICACEYFGRQESVDKCDGCRARGKRCYEEAFNDIASRLHALMPHDKGKREINAGDTIKDDIGMKMDVMDVTPLPVLALDDDGTSLVAVTSPHLWRVVRPDSWERLKEDLGLTCCTYFDDGNVTEDCNGCRAEELGGNMGGDCDKLMFDDIISRAKALAGVEQ